MSKLVTLELYGVLPSVSDNTPPTDKNVRQIQMKLQVQFMEGQCEVFSVMPKILFN
jgi:hypothetical protein